MKKLKFLLPLILLNVACDKEIPVDIPTKEYKLVIEAVLDPHSQKTQGVIITGSRHIFDSTSNTAVENATVLFYKDHVLLDTLHFFTNDTVYYYPIDKNVTQGLNAGDTCQISVSAPGYESVTSETFIPGKVEINEAVIQRVAYFDEDGNVHSKATMSFNDPPEKNYYELVLYSLWGHGELERLTTFEPYITSQSHYPSELNFDHGKPHSLLFTDDSFNGTGVRMEFYFFAGQIVDPRGRVLTSITECIELRNVTEQYYKFKSALYTCKYNNQGDLIYGMGEPFNMYSNIKNGYGVFGSFNKSIYSVHLDEIIVDQ